MQAPKQILLFDPSIATRNLGDTIIMDAVQRELLSVFEGANFVKMPTHQAVGRTCYVSNRSSDYSIVGGTNLLSSNMDRYNQWRINFVDALFLDNIILMGVGWWQYQQRPNLYTRCLLRKVLSRDYLHSVRDEYTMSKLSSIGVENAVNTGCPTMWRLTPELCRRIPVGQAETVVFCLTDYNKVPAKDAFLIETLRKTYRTIYFWPQGTGDLTYLKELGGEGISVLPQSLEAFDAFLSQAETLDYVGTRLHAGVRALQSGRRALVVGIDNRALEIQRDTNLPVLSREDLEHLPQMIQTGFETNIRLNGENIKRWRAQFCGSAAARNDLIHSRAQGGQGTEVPGEGGQAMRPVASGRLPTAFRARRKAPDA